MKKMFFSLVGLLVLGQTANATSLHPETFVNTRLELVVSPIGHGVPPTKPISVVVSVSSNGQVTFRDRFLSPVTIKRLSAYEMDRIERLIEAAKDGVIQHNQEFCLAIPTHSFRYSADQGRIFLKSGSSPCGGSIVNDTEAAKTLVRMLDNFYRIGLSINLE